MKKIGAIIPVWNQERFIGAHLKMISSLDKIVVMFEQQPLITYQKEHDYGLTKDNTEDIVKSFPNVEYYNAGYSGEFSAGLFNEGLQYVQDCDIVMKLDPDCFFTEKDWNYWLDFIRSNDYDCYHIDCKTNSVNYYIPNRFDRGIRDGLECEVYAFDPKKPLHGVTSYDAAKRYIIDSSWGDFTMHHFKGWKKSATVEWLNDVIENNKHGFNKILEGSGGWITAPQEIIDRLI